jgi:malonyl-CoA O-methyltransferase
MMRFLSRANFLHKTIADRLLARLPLFRIVPEIILNMGMNPAYTKPALAKLYRDAKVYDVMTTAQHTPLPFRKQSIDLIFSCLAFSTPDDITPVLAEFQRVLRPDGLLLFVTLGLDAFKELRQDSASPFVDMHDIGDLLTQMKWIDPVMDMHTIRLRYRKLKTLRRDLAPFVAAAAMPQDLPGELAVTIELIYGHAYGHVPSSTSNEILIPIEAIKKIKKH